MESTTNNSIFVFDHGQKKLDKAIGVTPDYLDDLQTKIGDTLRNYLFNEDRSMKDDSSPSQLVEACLHEFSYNQLVLMSAFFMQHKLDEFGEMIEGKLKKVKATIKKIALDADELPPHIRQMLEDLAKDGKGTTKSGAIDGNSLPKEIRDFLDNLARNSEDADEEDDD
jgi:hypothetical protein